MFYVGLFIRMKNRQKGKESKKLKRTRTREPLFSKFSPRLGILRLLDSTAFYRKNKAEVSQQH